MADDKTTTYQSLVTALPELKMVLVHAKNESQNAAEDRQAQSSIKSYDKKRAVLKIIDHLESDEES